MVLCRRTVWSVANVGYSIWSDVVKCADYVYREGRNAHSVEGCPASGKQLSCDRVDPQVDQLIGSLRLDPEWRPKILERLAEVSEVNQVLAEKDQLRERLRRLGRAFVDGLVEESEYAVQRKVLQDRLDALVVPELDAA